MKLWSLQIATIAMYELRMQWRRRTLMILSGVFVLALVAVVVPGIEQAGTLGLNQILLAVPLAVLILIAVIPALTAELIPLDHQYLIYDLIRTQPASRTTYLAGKVLSVWCALVMGECVVAVFIFAVALITAESFPAANYLELWLRVLPFMLLPAGITVLVGGVVATRRQAVLLGLLITPFFLVHYVLSMKAATSIPHSWAAFLLYMLVTGVLVRLYLALAESWE